MSFEAGWIIYLLIAFLGIILASYLNSWMWRVREGRWQWGGRSVCVHCSRALGWRENIPLVSFLWLRGKCRTCRGKIPLDYFLVELVLPFLLVLVTWYHVGQPSLNAAYFLRDFFFTALLTVVFVYDLKYYLILPSLTWVGTILALIFNFSAPGGSALGGQFSIFNQLSIFNLQSLLLGMAVGGGFFLLQYVVSRGRWIGGGDVHLGVMIGALLGWPKVLVALFIAYVFGAIVSIPLLVLKKKGMTSEIPFGTFLAVGTFVAMMSGGQIIRWYSGLIGL